MDYSTFQNALYERNLQNDSRNCQLAQKPILFADDGSEIELPYKWALCPVCNGKGTHVNPAIDCGGLTGEDFDRDPEFADNYFSGVYDIPCNRCGGRTTIPRIDLEKITPEQRHLLRYHHYRFKGIPESY